MRTNWLIMLMWSISQINSARQSSVTWGGGRANLVGYWMEFLWFLGSTHSFWELKSGKWVFFGFEWNSHARVCSASIGLWLSASTGKHITAWEEDHKLRTGWPKDVLKGSFFFLFVCQFLFLKIMRIFFKSFLHLTTLFKAPGHLYKLHL